ncbi:fasciclin domain-containing protein, partial [Streptomyces sp. NPDC058622]
MPQERFTMSNTLRIRRTALAVAAAVVLPFSLAACSESGKDAAAGSTADKSSDSAASEAATPAAPAADGPFGSACAGVPSEGAGSFDGMAKDPVAT